MKHKPCELHDECARPNGHDGACGFFVERVSAPKPPTELGWHLIGDRIVRVTEVLHVDGRSDDEIEPDGRPRLDVPAGAGLTEAQDDGRACVRCGLEGLPMLPTGKRGSHGAQLFECERHGRRGAT